MRVVAHKDAEGGMVDRNEEVRDKEFVFYPWEKQKEFECIMGYGRDIRIPMGIEEWKGVQCVCNVCVMCV